MIILNRYIIYVINIYIYVYIGSSPLLEPHGVGGGVGWDVNVHVTLRQDVNVHEPRKPELGW